MASIEKRNADRRISDADREEAVAHLRAAVVAGCLDLDEVGDRIGSVYEARTVGDLARITGDLPDQRPGGTGTQSSSLHRRSVFQSPSFRSHAVVYGLTNGFLVAIWAVTGADFFWPLFPAGGWGIALGSHAAAVAAHEQRRFERRKASTDHEHLQSGAARARYGRAEQRALPADRRIAVLFIDVVGSTHLATALGDEGWRQLRAHHREVVGASLSRYGGVEFNVSGDGVLARFDDEVAAVRCAVDIHRTLARRRAEVGFAPSVRTAVHAGTAVIEDDGDVVGIVVNLTCRVAGEAEPDEILVTEAVTERLGDRFTLVDRGLHHVKGFDEPRHLLSVKWD